MIVRLGFDEQAAALSEQHVSVFDITGKPMKNWVMVAAAGVADQGSVKAWVQRAMKFLAKLPAK